MLYFAHFYCQFHESQPQFFDNDKYKPCIGLCGHTVCLECIEKNSRMSCPICDRKAAFVNRTPNFKSIELIGEFREKYWDVFKRWWRCENLGQGVCSKCFSPEDHLRICLTCDDNHNCDRPISSMRLKLRSLGDLLTLAQNVFCTECTFKFHFDKGHKTIKIDNINFATRDIRRETSTMMMDLFRQKSGDREDLMDCKLRKQKLFAMENFLAVLIMSLDYNEEGECGFLSYLIRKELIEKYIESIDFINVELSENVDIKCECSRLYKTLEESQTAMNFQNVFGELSSPKVFVPGCPLYYQDNMEHRLKLYSIIKEVPEEKDTVKMRNCKNCPLCCLMDYKNCQDKPEYRNNWLNIIENIWRNDIPPIKTYCLRCLENLNHFNVGISCKKWKKIRKYDLSEEAPLKEEEWHDHFLCFFTKYLESATNCVQEDCVLKKSKNWKYAIISALHHKIKAIINDGIENAQSNCTLRKMRMIKTIRQLQFYLNDINLRRKTENDLLESIAQVERYLTSLRSQWDSYIVEAEKRPEQCICTAAMEYLDGAVRKRNHKKLKSYKKLKTLLESMADQYLTEEKNGCPLNFALPTEDQFPSRTSIKQFFSDFVASFCADDKLMMDSFHIKPKHEYYNFSESFHHLFSLE